MIPIRDVIPTRTRPVVVFTLIALNAAFVMYAVAALRPTTGLVIYVALNMLFLWLFGENVEDRTGHGRFLALAAMAGVLAAVVHGLAESGPDSRIAGAGGATAGVLGAYVALYPRSRIVTLVPLLVTVRVLEVPALYFLLVWFVLQWSAGTLGSHLAAFAAGICGVLALRRPERFRVEWWNPPSPRLRRGTLEDASVRIR
jgi:membrane associated rhomboid family serine protease